MNNTVIFMSDEHNPFYSSVYNHPFVKTPNMEKLKEIGTLYNNAYCPSPLCLPSRSSFLFGRRVHELQTYNNCNKNLKLKYEPFSSILGSKGIHLVHIGKAHYLKNIKQLGFNEVHLANETVSDTYFQRNPLAIRKDANKRGDGFGPKEGSLDSDIDSVNCAIKWLKNRSKVINKPWILYLNVLKPHFPHFVNKELWEMYNSFEDLPKYNNKYESSKHPYAKAQRSHFQVDEFDHIQTKGLRRGYYGCVTFVDQQLGKIMNTLKEEDLFNNTNLIYTSDHGELLGKFGMWWKCSLIEDAIRIPCIAAGPHFKKNSVIDTPVDLHDLQAFLFDSYEIDKNSHMLGFPLNKINNNDQDRKIFSEYHGHGAPGSSFMIRKGNWKYVYYIDAPNQLYNLETDPNELTNLIEKNYEISVELHKELEEICSPTKEHYIAEKFIESQLENCI